MQIKQLLTLAALSCSAYAEVYDITLQFISPNSSLNGQYLTSLHEGAGINYFFLAKAGEVLTYDEEKDTIYSTRDIPLHLNVIDDVLAYSVFEPAIVNFKGNNLLVNGETQFYAAQNISDPYQYSANAYAVLVGKNVPGSTEGYIVKQRVPSPSPSPSPTPSPSPSPSPTSWTNTTTVITTSKTTVTYTSMSTTVTTVTKCPATVTDCPYLPTTITTVVPITTTTVLRPGSVTPVLPTTAKETTQESTSKSAQHSLTHVSDNGTGKIYGSAFAGIAAILALAF